MLLPILIHCWKVQSESHSVTSNSLRLHGLCSPWNSSGQNMEWVAFPFSRASSQPRDRTQISCIPGGFLTSWVTTATAYLEALGCPSLAGRAFRFLSATPTPSSLGEVSWATLAFVCVRSKSLLSCLTLCDPMNCSPPGSCVHGILQARILERIAISSSKGSSWPRGQSHFSYASCIGRQFLYQLSHLAKLF